MFNHSESVPGLVCVIHSELEAINMPFYRYRASPAGKPPSRPWEHRTAQRGSTGEGGKAQDRSPQAAGATLCGRPDPSPCRTLSSSTGRTPSNHRMNRCSIQCRHRMYPQPGLLKSPEYQIGDDISAMLGAALAFRFIGRRAGLAGSRGCFSRILAVRRLKKRQTGLASTVTKTAHGGYESCAPAGGVGGSRRGGWKGKPLPWVFHCSCRNRN